MVLHKMSNLPDLQRSTDVADEGGDSINCSIAPYYFSTAGMVVEREPCVRGKMSENAMRRSKATACML